MDLYATQYKLVAEGKWSVAFQWDDSVITDSAQQLNDRMRLESIGAESPAEVRAWYRGQTVEAAQADIAAFRKTKPPLTSLLE
jgi:hypothetical protein